MLFTNGLQLENSNKILNAKKRFIKKKNKNDNQGNVVDFQKQSC